ncbi:hypothetical protein BANRA_02118 [Escherichia coli]|nr:hypothetical protein BANRA_02118 [Escherichia coli]
MRLAGSSGGQTGGGCCRKCRPLSGEWGDYFRMQSFSDVWMDAQFASLKALIVRMVSGSSDAAVADFSLLPEENGIPERTDEELMHLGEGISGGVRYGPDSQPGH